MHIAGFRPTTVPFIQQCFHERRLSHAAGSAGEQTRDGVLGQPVQTRPALVVPGIPAGTWETWGEGRNRTDDGLCWQP